MANMYDISSLNYQPSTNMDWFTKAIFGGKLIEKGKITPVVGVKESTLINLIDVNGSILQADARDCSWNPQQMSKLSDRCSSYQSKRAGRNRKGIHKHSGRCCRRRITGRYTEYLRLLPYIPESENGSWRHLRK